jgi:manganese-dependent inorganic pyrophosphatase
MDLPTIIVGHRNPDNDAISSAVAYAYFKNEMAKRNDERDADGNLVHYEPCRLGPLPPETQWVLERNGIDLPREIDHVYTRVCDVMTSNPISINQNATLVEAGRLLHQHNFRALVAVDDDGAYQGLITQRKIAERYLDAADKGDEKAVADDLVASLSEKVADAVETDALVLEGDALLREATEDLLSSSLREAVVLDDAGECIGILTRTDVANPPKRKVILVDHNEVRQAAPGIESADVVEIVDHHRIGDVSTSHPIRFINLPYGSTATILTKLFREHGIDIPKGIAEVLLSAILTDTVVLKSPTAGPVDHEQVRYLSEIIGCDYLEFGTQVFQTRGNDAEMPVEELVGADAKEFQLGDATLLIAQHETVTLQPLLDREDEIRAYMRQLAKAKGYEFVLVLLTDILKEGSQFLVEGNHRIVDKAFGIDTEAGSVWMPGILSRKKQVAARILA